MLCNFCSGVACSVSVLTCCSTASLVTSQCKNLLQYVTASTAGEQQSTQVQHCHVENRVSKREDQGLLKYRKHQCVWSAHVYSSSFVHEVLKSFHVQVAALPMFYNDNKMGCEIPDQAYGGHAAPEESELVRPPFLSPPTPQLCCLFLMFTSPQEEVWC